MSEKFRAQRKIPMSPIAVASMKNDLGREYKKVKIGGRKRICWLCTKLKFRTASNKYVESSWMCNHCKVCLCIDCSEIFHAIKLCWKLSMCITVIPKIIQLLVFSLRNLHLDIFKKKALFGAIQSWLTSSQYKILVVHCRWSELESLRL